MGVRNRRPVVRFLAYARPYMRLMVIATLCGMAKFILPSTTALTLKFITDRLVAPTSATPIGRNSHDVIMRVFDAYLRWATLLLPTDWRTTWASFNILVGTLVLIYAAWAVLFYYRGLFANVAGQRTVLDLRTDLYVHLNRLSHSFFQSHQSGAIVSRLMADVALAQDFVGNAMSFAWMDLVTCIFYVYVLFAMDTPLAAAALLVFPFYILAMRRFGSHTTRASRDVQEALAVLSGELQERVTNIHAVKIFRAEKWEMRTFFSRARRLYELTIKNLRLTLMANSIVQWLTQMATVGLIWYGSYRLVHGKTTMGTLIASILLLRELYVPVTRISEINSVLHGSLAAIERVFEFLDTVPDIEENPQGARPNVVNGSLRFDNVTFGYDRTRPVLHNVDLTIPPGEVIALVGPSGAGKSSLVQLVPRFYDPQGGRVLLDGVDIRTMSLRHLRAHIAMVSQETLLFSGTAMENIRYGRRDATDLEVYAAAQAANAHEFIMGLPQGYDSVLGERGCRLSGGQKQRIAIARAFLANPRILILDEATSALDSESEAVIQETLARLMRGRTSIVIAHRLSTVLGSDRIAVMQNGRIVEIGRHEALLSRNGLYTRLYQTQFRTSGTIVA